MKRSDGVVSADRAQVAPEVFVGREVFHYSIPVVQEKGTGQIENGDRLASAKQVVNKPVVLVSKLNPRKATICIAAPQPGFLTLCSTEFVALNADRCELRFLDYLVRSELFRQLLDSKVQSVTRSHQRAKPDDVYKFWNAWPSISEQRAIAGFLDRETARLDTLVGKKRELIEKLKEKRTALISRTVTHGLNPNIKLKPSGIEWLGDIPEHWEVRRIATVADKITNGFVGPTRDILVDEGVRYLQSLHIKNNKILFEKQYFVEPEWSKQHQKSVLKAGYVLIVQTGDIGQVACVSKEFEGCNCHALIIVGPTRGKLDGRFLSWFLLSNFGFDELKRIQTGALHPHLNCTFVRDVRFSYPPISEQQLIADYLDGETAKIDEMIEKVEAAIEKLREYRTALITAAVTGKIDVLNGRT